MNLKTLKSKISAIAKCEVRHRISRNGDVVFYMPHEESRWNNLYKAISKGYRSSGPLKQAGSNILYPMRGGNIADGIVIRTGLCMSKKGLRPLDKDFINIHNNVSHAIKKAAVNIQKEITSDSAISFVTKVAACFPLLVPEARRALSNDFVSLFETYARLGTGNKRKEHSQFIRAASGFADRMLVWSERMEQDVFKINLGITNY